MSMRRKISRLVRERGQAQGPISGVRASFPLAPPEERRGPDVTPGVRASETQFAVRPGEPSFRHQLMTLRRSTSHLRDIDPKALHPLRQLHQKLRNYALASSHGCAVPQVWASWSTPEQIEVGGLPDAFVLKADGGASGRGVLPLRRVDEDRFITIDGARHLSTDEIIQYFRDRLDRKKIMAPFFAEEVLVQPGGGPIPDDIKVYAFYGEIQQILLRRVSRHHDPQAQARRYIRADGSDLGAVVTDVPIDLSIPLPKDLGAVHAVAAHLSRAVGVPFVRVDLYGTEAGLVLGELTRAPGGNQRIRPDHDRDMGLAWERAQYRLDMDLIAGRPAGRLHGPSPTANAYPGAHVSRTERAGDRGWLPPVVPCSEWCNVHEGL